MPATRGGDRGTRTPNLCIANAALSQLSYIPTAAPDSAARPSAYHTAARRREGWAGPWFDRLTTNQRGWVPGTRGGWIPAFAGMTEGLCKAPRGTECALCALKPHPRASPATSPLLWGGGSRLRRGPSPWPSPSGGGGGCALCALKPHPRASPATSPLLWGGGPRLRRAPRSAARGQVEWGQRGGAGGGEGELAARQEAEGVGEEGGFQREFGTADLLE